MKTRNYIGRNVMDHIRQVGPAMRLVVTTARQIFVLVGLGMAALYLAGHATNPAHHLLMGIAESLLLLGGVWMLIGSFRVWWAVIRAEIGHR